MIKVEDKPIFGNSRYRSLKNYGEILSFKHLNLTKTLS